MFSENEAFDSHDNGVLYSVRDIFGSGLSLAISAEGFPSLHSGSAPPENSVEERSDSRLQPRSHPLEFAVGDCQSRKFSRENLAQSTNDASHAATAAAIVAVKSPEFSTHDLRSYRR